MCVSPHYKTALAAVSLKRQGDAPGEEDFDKGLANGPKGKDFKRLKNSFAN